MNEQDNDRLNWAALIGLAMVVAFLVVYYLGTGVLDAKFNQPPAREMPVHGEQITNLH